MPVIAVRWWGAWEGSEKNLYKGSMVVGCGEGSVPPPSKFFFKNLYNGSVGTVSASYTGVVLEKNIWGAWPP